MAVTFTSDELISVSELRKDISRIKRFLKSGKKNRYLLTDNGKIFAVVMEINAYEKNPPLNEIHLPVKKKKHTKEDLEKVLFNGPKNLSQMIDDIY